MSDKAPASKNRLAGLIPAKGAAPRPIDEPQRSAAHPAPPPAAPPPMMGTVKSLTLRLPGEEYERLRRFAFDNRTTHQDVLSAALREYLDARS